VTVKQAQAVYVAAQKMSNWLYNMSYDASLKERQKEMLYIVGEWDMTKTPLAKLTVPSKTKRPR
jgi:hypothetical protein